MRATPGWLVLFVSLWLPASPATALVLPFDDFGAFSAATTSLLIEDFEAGPWSAAGTKAQGTSNLGVTWTTADQMFVSIAVSLSPKHSLSDVNGAPDSVDRISAALPAGVQAVGAFVGTFGQDHAVTLTAFDAGDAALGSITSPSTPFATLLFAGLVANVPIARVELRSEPGDGDDFAIDDFSFGAAGVVPEPSTGGLLALGLAGLGAHRRRATARGRLAGSVDSARLRLASRKPTPASVC